VFQCWLDHDKPIVRQLPQHRLDFRFIVKFYTPDPGLLEEEYTRFIISLVDHLQQVIKFITSDDLQNSAFPLFHF